MSRLAMLIVCLVAIRATLSPLPAAADDASIGLSLAPLIGRHEEPSFVSHVPPIPIPILQVRGRKGNVELFAEGLPVALPIDEHSPFDSFSTRLTFFDAVVRAYAPGDRFSAGIGTLVYNQTSTFTAARVITSSRVDGARYELGVGLLPDAKRLRLFVDVMPAMHGDIHQRVPYAVSDINSSEVGSEVELQLLGTNERGPFRLEYGARYINYATKFADDGSLADHNVGVLPFVTFLYHVGHP